jgi:nucleotide-binding universal stress UspA family protein
MRTIVAAIDNSAAAAPTLRSARRFADLLDAEVEALNVIEPSDEQSPAATTAEGVAAQLGMLLRRRSGVAADEIVAELRRSDVVAAVLGARGSPAGRRPAGHTALAVVQRSAKPVIVVPPTSLPRRTGTGGRVLVPLDGTESSARAVEPTAAMFAERGVDVLVLHVFDDTTVPRFWDHPEHEAQDFGEEFLRRYCRAEGAHLRLQTGDPGHVVLDASGEPEVDLVALAWSQDLSPGHARTVRTVLSGCPVPVMLVPVEASTPPRPAPSMTGSRER